MATHEPGIAVLSSSNGISQRSHGLAVTALPSRTSSFFRRVVHLQTRGVEQLMVGMKDHGRRKRSTRGYDSVIAGVEQFSSDDFQVERLLSTYGYINVSSYVGPQPRNGLGGLENLAAGLDRRDMNQMSGIQMGEGGVQTRIYAGRIARGERMGTRCLLKAYPGVTVRGSEVDMMAVNELVSHAILQESVEDGTPPNLAYLFGGFQTRTGEQWLVFRDNGQYTGADYAKAASQATVEGNAVGQWDFWDRFDKDRPIVRRRIYITKLLRGAFRGLAFMHANGRLHQSLGPASIILNTLEEREVQYLVPHLRDLAFATDVSDQAILAGSASTDAWERRNTISDFRDLSTESPAAALSASLWRRAAAAGARTSLEKKAFGIADDIYAGGLLLVYMVFVPLCEPGSIDGPSLQRLFESTFRLDVMAAREYCAADERWDEAVKFMDLDDGAGWQLLQAMLNPNYRMRPTAEAVLNHRFMSGDIFE